VIQKRPGVLRFAKRHALWLGAGVWLAAAQGCVGPDLEPPGGSKSSTPASGLPTMPGSLPSGAMDASAPNNAPVIGPQPGQTPTLGAAGSVPTMTTPGLMPVGTAGSAAAEAAEDAGVADAGTVRR
jgi:hypothetical protein